MYRLILQSKKVRTCYKIIINPINVNSAKNELQVRKREREGGRVGRMGGWMDGWMNV